MDPYGFQVGSANPTVKMFILLVQLEHTSPEDQGAQDQQQELVLARKRLTLHWLFSENNIIIRQGLNQIKHNLENIDGTYLISFEQYPEF